MKQWTEQEKQAVSQMIFRYLELPAMATLKLRQETLQAIIKVCQDALIEKPDDDLRMQAEQSARNRKLCLNEIESLADLELKTISKSNCLDDQGEESVYPIMMKSYK